MELLVVISLIVLLIAMLQPSLQQARITAQTAECSSRLHNIGIASHAYADDNKDYMPRDAWYNNNSTSNPTSLGHYSFLGRYSEYVNGPRVATDDDGDINVLLDAARHNDVWQCPGEGNKAFLLAFVSNGVDFPYYNETGGYTSGATSKWTSHPGSPSELGHLFEANTINFNTPTDLGLYDVFSSVPFRVLGRRTHACAAHDAAR